VEGSQSIGLQVVLSGGGEMDRRADIGSSGVFNIPDVPAGQYELTVTTLYGDVIHREYVVLNEMMNHISVRLPEQKVERPASGTVSARQLQHKIPSKARKEFEKGRAAARKKDSVAAIEHLTKATEMDPGFMEAYNDLGVQYLRADKYDSAMAQFQRATELDPGASTPHTNLAASLVILERHAEAETAARKAIRLDARSATARYFLGLALLQQQKNTSEALDNLQRASETVPRARLAIAEIVERRGDVERARNELQAYLNSGKLQDREAVQSWLANLPSPKE
jgi:Flp pilus assembly protein TadD